MFSLAGMKVLVVGIANAQSIAYGCARAMRQQGADLAGCGLTLHDLIEHKLCLLPCQGDTFLYVGNGMLNRVVSFRHALTLQKVFQHGMAMFGQDGFGVKLHAKGRVLDVT